jgi:hypothetical protein
MVKMEGEDEGYLNVMGIINKQAMVSNTRE